MKEIIIEISETKGRVKTAIRDGAQLNTTPTESGVSNYLTYAVQLAIDKMYDGAEAIQGGAK